MNLEITLSIYGGGAGSGCNPAAGTCGRRSSGGYVYHVTHTNLVPKIQKEGLRPMQTTNWLRAGDKSRYGKGEVHSFDHPHDALRWAAKMDWDFHSKTGSGKVSILKVNKGAGNWEEDTGHPLEQASSKGKWLKSMGRIAPKDVVDSVPFKQEHVQYLMRGTKKQFKF